MQGIILYIHSHHNKAKPCIICGNYFQVANSEVNVYVVCSDKCKEIKRNLFFITKYCVICNAPFSVYKHNSNAYITCSKLCSSKHRSVITKNRTVTWGDKISNGRKGKKNKKQYSDEYRRKMHLIAKKGSESHLWTGANRSENKKIRDSVEYKIWRDSVYRRDNYTCQICHQRGGKLHADHIKQFAYYPDLRFELTNGRTLCVECHKKTDTYLSKGRKAFHGIDILET